MFNNLRSIRNEKGISADMLAEVLGLSTKAAYYKKESGNVKFTLTEAKKISDYFRMPIEKLFFENGISCEETSKS